METDTLTAQLAKLTLREDHMYRLSARTLAALCTHAQVHTDTSSKIWVSSLAQQFGNGTQPELYTVVSQNTSVEQAPSEQLAVFRKGGMTAMQQGTAFEELVQAAHLYDTGTPRDPRLRTAMEATATPEGVALARVVSRAIRDQGLVLLKGQPPLYKKLPDSQKPVLKGIPDWIVIRRAPGAPTVATLELKTTSTDCQRPTVAHCVQACYQAHLAQEALGLLEPPPAYICVVNFGTHTVCLFTANQREILALVGKSAHPAPGLPLPAVPPRSDPAGPSALTLASSGTGEALHATIKAAVRQYEDLKRAGGGAPRLYLAGLLRIRNGQYVTTSASKDAAELATQTLLGIPGLKTLDPNSDLNEAYQFFKMGTLGVGPRRVSNAAWKRLVDKSGGVVINGQTISKWALVHVTGGVV